MADDQTQQPMILVKKPDGTSVRVPLSSLQGTKSGAQEVNQMVSSGTTTPPLVVDMSENQPAAKEHVEQKMLPPEPPQVLLEESYEDDELSKDTSIATLQHNNTQTSPPVVLGDVRSTRLPVDMAQNVVHSTSQWSADDHASLLTETLDTQTPHEVSSIRGDDQVLAFLTTMSVSIKSELRGRAIALLSSFLKGVRSRQQLLEYAVKPVQTGGLQLSDVEAQSLVQQAEGYFHLRPTTGVRRPPSATVKEPVRTEISVPLPDVSRPAYTHIQQSDVLPHMSDIIPPPAAMPVQEVPVPVETMSGTAQTAASESLGPIEEIQTFTKDDFRRLNADPTQAANTLLLQMQHVGEESPMLGLSVRRAWFLSPLYREYLSMLEQSLQEAAPLSEIRNMLTVEEVCALLNIHRACEEV